ncbi:hypothetical protein ACQ4WX_08180 [Streptomyces lasalocidi]
MPTVTALIDLGIAGPTISRHRYGHLAGQLGGVSPPAGRLSRRRVPLAERRRTAREAVPDGQPPLGERRGERPLRHP